MKKFFLQSLSRPLQNLQSLGVFTPTSTQRNASTWKKKTLLQNVTPTARFHLNNLITSLRTFSTANASKSEDENVPKKNKKEQAKGGDKESATPAQPTEPAEPSIVGDLIASGTFKEADLTEALAQGSKFKRTYAEFMFLQDMTEAMDTLASKSSNAEKRRHTNVMLERAPLLSGDRLLRSMKLTTTYRTVVREKKTDDTKGQKVFNLSGKAILALAEALDLGIVSSNMGFYPTSKPKAPQFERIPDDSLPCVFLIDVKRFQYSASRYEHAAFGLSTKATSASEEKVIWVTPDATPNDQWHKCYQATELLLGGNTVSFQVRMDAAKRRAALEATEREARAIADEKHSQMVERAAAKESAELGGNVKKTGWNQEDDDDDSSSSSGLNFGGEKTKDFGKTTGKYYKKKTVIGSNKGTGIQVEMFDKMLRISQVLAKIRDDNAVEILREKVAALDDRLYRPEDVTEIALIKTHAENPKYEVNEKQMNDSKSKNNVLFSCSSENLGSKTEVFYQPKKK